MLDGKNKSQVPLLLQIKKESLKAFQDNYQLLVHNYHLSDLLQLLMLMLQEILNNIRLKSELLILEFKN